MIYLENDYLNIKYYENILYLQNDKIEIVSFPGPDRSVTLEGLKSYHVSNRRYRNRRIGDFLKELHLTEGRNTGFHKILTALRQNGSPEPSFETDEDRVYFLTTIYARGAHGNANDGQSTDSDANTELAWRDRSISNVVAERQHEILVYMQANPTASIAEISKALNIAKSTMDRDIRSLKDQGRLYRDGSRVAGTWHTNLGL